MSASVDPDKLGIPGRFTRISSNGVHEGDRFKSDEQDTVKRRKEVPYHSENCNDSGINNNQNKQGKQLNITLPDSQSGSDTETSFTTTQAPASNVTICTDNLQPDQVTLKSHLASMTYLAVVILAPLICLPIILCVDESHQRAARCGYTIAVMAIYWGTECIPIAVTSLLPVILLPALGVLTAKNTTAAYFNDTSMLFVGGLLAAIAVEVWDVHKRIALLVLKVVGAEPKCLLLGMTLVTWFLSMWMSNTATTAMMMTIVKALLEQFRGIKDGNIQHTQESQKKKHVKENSETTEADVEKNREDAEFARLSKALSLTVAYAANIGGIASLTGTGPNLVLFAAAQKTFEAVGLRSPISFGTWLIYGVPLSLILVFIMWMWMVFIILRCGGGCGCCQRKSASEHLQKVNQMIKDEYQRLGPVTYAQGSVMIIFVTLILAWITRDLGGVGGWGSWFLKDFVSDSTPSILFGVLMFVLPSSFPLSFLRRRNRAANYSKITPLLSWKHIHEKMPWSLYLLLGGGYALAKSATDSGLSTWLGEQLLVFSELNHWVILLIICYIITFVTEVTSNTAIATLMMPILSEMAIRLRLNPLFLMFPAALTTSFAFMLPVATPPNAIVFSSGAVRVIDMVISGLFLNCISVPVLLFATATWGNAFFKFDQIPVEFLANITKV